MRRVLKDGADFHLVQLAPSCHFKGSGGGGVLQVHQLGHHPLHLPPVEPPLRIPVLKVHSCNPTRRVLTDAMLPGLSAPCWQ